MPSRRSHRHAIAGIVPRRRGFRGARRRAARTRRRRRSPRRRRNRAASTSRCGSRATRIAARRSRARSRTSTCPGSDGAPPPAVRRPRRRRRRLSRASTRRRRRAATTCAARCSPTSSPPRRSCSPRRAPPTRTARPPPLPEERADAEKYRAAHRAPAPGGAAARDERRGAEEGARRRQVTDARGAARSRRGRESCCDIALRLRRHLRHRSGACHDRRLEALSLARPATTPAHAFAGSRAARDRGAAARRRAPRDLRQSRGGEPVRAVAADSSSAIRPRAGLRRCRRARPRRSTRRCVGGASYTEQELELGVAGKPKLHLTCTVSPVDTRDAALLLEFRHIDQQLKIAREERLHEQQQANRELIRSLAHEIKNPLGGIRGAAQLLERELDRPQLIEYTQVIIGEADRLQSLVNRLLTPHRLPTYQRTNIHEILVRVKGVVQAEFPRDRDRLRFRHRACRSSTPIRSSSRRRCSTSCATPRRRCDGTTAGPADPPHDARRALRDARARSATGSRSRSSIEDNGPGIPEAIRDRIFYPLVSGREGGSGLGLTIAQTFVAQHGGTIECESVPGRTVFTILLPLELGRAAHTRDERQRCHAYDYEPPRGNAAMKPVWIVDDDRSIRWVLEKALAREGIPFKTFVVGVRGAAGARGRASRRCSCPTSGCPASRASRCSNKVKERYPQHPGDHHDRVLGSRQRRRRVPGRRVRVPAEAVRRRSRGRADPPRDDRDAGARAGRAGGGARRRRCWARRRRCRKSSARSAACRNRTRRCSSPASRAPARSSSRARCTGTARAPRGRSSRSTRRRSRRTCSSPSSSATSAARSPARRARAAAASSRPRAARCSSTRSATCRPTCRCACCACSPTASTTASAATRR